MCMIPPAWYSVGSIGYINKICKILVCKYLLVKCGETCCVCKVERYNYLKCYGNNQIFQYQNILFLPCH